MPAKGWRKDEQESNLDTAIANEGQSIDSYLFPKATINKLMKQILQSNNDTNESNYLISKDVQTVVQRAAILFINFLYHTSKQIVKKQNRKVVNADDILNSLNLIGFGEFNSILNVELDKFNSKKESKKLAKLKQKEMENANVEMDVDESASNDTSKRIKLDSLINPPTVDDTISEGDSTIIRNTTTENVVADDDDDEEVGDLEEEDGEEENGVKIDITSQLQQEQLELEGDDPDKDIQQLEDDEDDDEDNEEEGADIE